MSQSVVHMCTCLRVCVNNYLILPQITSIVFQDSVKDSVQNTSKTIFLAAFKTVLKTVSTLAISQSIYVVNLLLFSWGWTRVHSNTYFHSSNVVAVLFYCYHVSYLHWVPGPKREALPSLLGVKSILGMETWLSFHFFCFRLQILFAICRRCKNSIIVFDWLITIILNLRECNS